MYWVATVLAGGLTLYVIFKLWSGLFFKEQEGCVLHDGSPAWKKARVFASILFVILALALVVVVLGPFRNYTDV